MATASWGCSRDFHRQSCSLGSLCFEARATRANRANSKASAVRWESAADANASHRRRHVLLLMPLAAAAAAAAAAAPPHIMFVVVDDLGFDVRAAPPLPPLPFSARAQPHS